MTTFPFSLRHQEVGIHYSLSEIYKDNKYVKIIMKKHRMLRQKQLHVFIQSSCILYHPYPEKIEWPNPSFLTIS